MATWFYARVAIISFTEYLYQQEARFRLICRDLFEGNQRSEASFCIKIRILYNTQWLSMIAPS